MKTAKIAASAQIAEEAERNSMVSVKPYQQAVASTAIQVDAYGQHCSVDVSCMTSLAAIKSSVQVQLGMEEQALLIHDADGNALASDADLQVACEAGCLPLQASVADTAIHHIQGKRDEMAQMQWRVVREQFTTINKASNSMAGQLTGLQGTINQQKIELQLLEERLRNEFRGVLAKETADRHDDMKNACSKVEELARAIQAEKSTRELVTMQHEKQFDSVTLAFEGMKQKLELVNKIRVDLDNVKTGIQSEVKASEQVLANKISELQFLEVTYQELGKLIRQETQERESTTKGILEKLYTSTDNLQQQLRNTISEQQTFKRDVTDRVDHLNETYSISHQRITSQLDAVNQEIVSTNKHFVSFEKDLESNRLEQKKNLAGVSQATEKVSSLREQIEHCEEHCKTMIDQEQLARTNQNRALWNAISIYTMEAKARAPGVYTPRSTSAKSSSAPAVEIVTLEGGSSLKDDAISHSSQFSGPPERYRSETSGTKSSSTAMVPTNVKRSSSANFVVSMAVTHSVPSPRTQLAGTPQHGFPIPVQLQAGANFQPRPASRSPSAVNRQSSYPTISSCGGNVNVPSMSNCFGSIPSMRTIESPGDLRKSIPVKRLC